MSTLKFHLLSKSLAVFLDLILMSIRCEVTRDMNTWNGKWWWWRWKRPALQVSFRLPPWPAHPPIGLATFSSGPLTQVKLSTLCMLCTIPQGNGSMLFWNGGHGFLTEVATWWKNQEAHHHQKCMFYIHETKEMKRYLYLPINIYAACRFPSAAEVSLLFLGLINPYFHQWPKSGPL